MAWPESAGRVHDGFAVAVRALRPQILDWIASTKPDLNRLILTGHSLGAAMATLAASIWRACVAGDDWVAAGWRCGLALRRRQQSTAVRFVEASLRCGNLEVPPEIGDYASDIKDYTYLTRDAGIVENLESRVRPASIDRRGASRAHGYSLKQLLTNVSVRDLADHAPINYARVMFDSI